MAAFDASTLTIDPEPDGSLVLKIDLPGRSLNVVSRQFLDDLDAALAWLQRRSRVPVLVIRSGKKTGFLAGADLRELAGLRDASEAVAVSRRGQEVFNRLAALHAPTIAAIHGPCLGGGLELALACDYRLVFDRPDTYLALPEIELGLLPAWGGTMRLPRVVGLERALQVILTGKRLLPREALAWGLADAVADDEPSLRDQMARLLVRATMAGKRDRTTLPIRTWRQRFLEGNWLGRKIVFQGIERMVRAKTPDDLPAPLEALEAVRAGVTESASAGLRRETEAAGRLALSPACRNLVGLFFQRETAKKLSPILGEPRPIEKVAVIGAGFMGAAIAQLAALAGREVLIKERDEQAVAAGNARLDALFAKLVERGKTTPGRSARCREAIRLSTTYHDFNTADLVIEAVAEELPLKRTIFAELSGKTKAILATTTISYTIASLCDVEDPGRVAGLHFFHPVHKTPLVEVVRHASTTAETVGRLMRFVFDLGKTPVAVGDGPGFIVNAVLAPYLEEAVLLLSEGLPTTQIDRLMRRFGMPLGPFQMLDQMGLDEAAQVFGTLGLTGQSGASPLPSESQTGIAAQVFARMREAGEGGKKTGRSFYLDAQLTNKADAETQSLAASLGTPPPGRLPLAVRLAEARERLVLRMVNEAARRVDNGQADADTVDLVLVLGIGWAPHRGGPLRYADQRGLVEVTQALTALAERLGPRFAPVEGLTRRERFRADE